MPKVIVETPYHRIVEVLKQEPGRPDFCEYIIERNVKDSLGKDAWQEVVLLKPAMLNDTNRAFYHLVKAMVELNGTIGGTANEQ